MVRINAPINRFYQLADAKNHPSTQALSEPSGRVQYKGGSRFWSVDPADPGSGQWTQRTQDLVSGPNPTGPSLVPISTRPCSMTSVLTSTCPAARSPDGSSARR